MFSSEMRYLASTFLNNLGTGLMLTVQAVFVTKNLGISPAHFGFVLTCGAVLGLFAGVALGKWSDGRNLRRLMPAFGVLQAMTAAGYLVSSSVWLLGVVVGLGAIAGRGGAAVRGPFMAALVGRERLVTYRAKVRSVANAAMAVGAALGGIALGFGSGLAVGTAMGMVPVGYLLGALLTASVTLPHAGGTKAGPKKESAVATQPSAQSLPVQRNLRFLIVVGLNAVLMVHVPLLGVAFPLWISGRTSAPSYLISVVVLINTVGVVLLQVPISKFVKTPRDAARACLATGVALASASLLLVYSSKGSALLQAAVIVVAALLHLVGEVWQSAASWELAFELAPEDRLGEYQGAFNSGMDLSLMLGPAVFGMLVSAPSLAGWWILAATLVLAGRLMGLAVRRAVPAGETYVNDEEEDHRG
ncbi:MFS transporter [Actinomyces radicidentis]|uniref:MFS transporter n=1 Tax=Actinomyces radicidentis TaxID=111015 RepID=A0A0X8JDJ0_ACTRD|nr:MFS transporter [Actinomyces radicidentis]AMD86609.1 hypothetical protein AXF14_02105 [Actinomyces radicidentis]